MELWNFFYWVVWGKTTHITKPKFEALSYFVCCKQNQNELYCASVLGAVSNERIRKSRWCSKLLQQTEISPRSEQNIDQHFNPSKKNNRKKNREKQLNKFNAFILCIVNRNLRVVFVQPYGKWYMYKWICVFFVCTLHNRKYWFEFNFYVIRMPLECNLQVVMKWFWFIFLFRFLFALISVFCLERLNWLTWCGKVRVFIQIVSSLDWIGIHTSPFSLGTESQ